MTDINTWISDTMAGTTFCYLTAPSGWLSRARDDARAGKVISASDRAKLEQANTAVDLYLQGRIELVQRLVSRRNVTDADYEYLAVRREHRAKRQGGEMAAWNTWRTNAATPIQRARPRVSAI